jgi:hypothetical protein
MGGALITRAKRWTAGSRSTSLTGFMNTVCAEKGAEESAVWLTHGSDENTQEGQSLCMNPSVWWWNPDPRERRR